MNSFDLTGRVAVVTGGNGGIGLAIAEALAQAGARVVIAARDQAKAADAMESLARIRPDCAFVETDVSSHASCQKLAEAVASRFGGGDILVNNAGMTVRKAPEDLSPEEWDRVLGINLSGAFFTAQAFHPHMKAKGGGKIINIGSIYSLLGAPLVAAYAASKGGIVQLSRALACAWAPHNIQVNAVLPGFVDTDLTRSARSQIGTLDETVVTRTPAGRWGEPSDIAGAAVFLASAASNFVTGTTLTVDGGYSVRG